jgi:hypothetical protein
MDRNYNPAASPYLPEAVPYNPNQHSNLPEVYHGQNHATASTYPQQFDGGAPVAQPYPHAYSPSPSHPPRYSELGAGSAPPPKLESEYREEPVLLPRQPWWRRHLLLICLAAVLIVGAAVGGGVGGALAAEKKKGSVSSVEGQQEGAGAG